MPKRSHSRPKDFVIIKRRMEIAKLYAEGVKQYDIAERMGISVITVSKDLYKIRKYWLSLMMTEFDKKKAEQLAKLDNIEAEAMAAWHASKEDAETHHKRVLHERMVVQPPKGDKGVKPKIEMIPVKELEETTKSGRVGDPRFLQIAKECVEQRAKLLGFMEEKAGDNIYLNFGDLLKEARNQPSSATIIENQIKQVGHNSTNTNDSSS